ncbi:Alpha/Beta hydrolase protein [Pestalotiopsis sp. NC0098]|nr:Alpha/Beta hydrolase protein [Pestalotiopsis sp. NC0098]
MSSSLTYEVHRYGKDHELQRVGVWRSPDAKPQSSNPWIIYIHGGAWRDFRIDHTTFRPTIDALLKQGNGHDNCWAGFASVDYRLSPHPSFPQDPASTPAAELRAAQHPDHIRDVRAALGYLQARYGFGADYVLLGHSAGATLALQLLMGTGAAADDDVALPRAVLGLEGIYDLPGLADRLGPAYAELFRGAFPGGREAWAEVSPLRFAGDFGECWGKSDKKLVVLGWGPQDELIDEPEIDGMAKRLAEDKVHAVVVKDLEGTHDGMWEDGRPFAKVVLQALAELRK